MPLVPMAADTNGLCFAPMDSVCSFQMVKSPLALFIGAMESRWHDSSLAPIPLVPMAADANDSHLLQWTVHANKQGERVLQHCSLERSNHVGVIRRWHQWLAPVIGTNDPRHQRLTFAPMDSVCQSEACKISLALVVGVIQPHWSLLVGTNGWYQWPAPTDLFRSSRRRMSIRSVQDLLSKCCWSD